MRNGGLDSALRSIASHLSTLRADSVIMVVGNRIQVKETENVVYYTNDEAERLSALPKNIWMVLSTRQRSHRLGDNLRVLADARGMALPQYLLPSNIIKQVIAEIGGWLAEQAEPAPMMAMVAATVAPTPFFPPPVVLEEYRPLAEKKREWAKRPKPLRMLPYWEAKRICLGFITPDDRKRMAKWSYTRIILEFGCLLEAGNYNMTDGDFSRLVAFFRPATKPSLPLVPKRRRDGKGNLPRRSILRMRSGRA